MKSYAIRKLDIATGKFEYVVRPTSGMTDENLAAATLYTSITNIKLAITGMRQSGHEEPGTELQIAVLETKLVGVQSMPFTAIRKEGFVVASPVIDPGYPETILFLGTKQEVFDYHGLPQFGQGGHWTMRPYTANVFTTEKEAQDYIELCRNSYAKRDAIFRDPKELLKHFKAAYGDWPYLFNRHDETDFGNTLTYDERVLDWIEHIVAPQYITMDYDVRDRWDRATVVQYPLPGMKFKGDPNVEIRTSGD